MNGKILALGLAAMSLLGSCKGKEKAEAVFPANFNEIGDAGRVDYMIAHVSPDSVARFIIEASLGHVKGARIDTLAIATNHAYERLQGRDLEEFGITYDSMVESLPLDDKMKVYKLAGSEDPQGLGYRLGLEYMSSIRNSNKSAAEVDRELEAFRQACGTDTAMYRRFMIGFRTVLEIDGGQDVSKDILVRYLSNSYE